MASRRSASTLPRPYHGEDRRNSRRGDRARWTRPSSKSPSRKSVSKRVRDSSPKAAKWAARMLPPETPLTSVTSSSRLVDRPSSVNSVAFSSCSTPRPKAAARAPPPDSATAATTGRSTAAVAGRACSSARTGWFCHGRKVEQPVSSSAANSVAKCAGETRWRNALAKRAAKCAASSAVGRVSARLERFTAACSCLTAA